jgi:hypothetical protein
MVVWVWIQLFGGANSDKLFGRVAYAISSLAARVDDLLVAATVPT